MITHFFEFHLKQVIYVFIHMNVKNDPGVLFLFTQVAFSTVNIHVNANKHHVDLFLFTQVAFQKGTSKIISSHMFLAL